MNKTMQALRRFALRYPEVQEGIACEGTALEKRTVKAGNKAFLFLGPGDAMVKLRESLPEATRLAAKEPSRYKAGAHGWVTAKFSDDGPPRLDLLERWIDESYRVVANKQPTAPVQERDTATPKKKVRRS